MAPRLLRLLFGSWSFQIIPMAWGHVRFHLDVFSCQFAKEILRYLRKSLFKIVALLLIYSVLTLPDGIKVATALYSSSTESLPLVYTFTYYFSWLELPLIVLGFLCYRNSKVINILPLFFLILLLNIIRIPMGLSNVFDLNSYEMFLILLVGICAVVLCSRIADTQHDFEVCIDLFVVVQAFTQLLNYVVGVSSDGRFGALAMGAGQTATMMSLYIVWFITCRNSGWKLNEKTGPFSIIALCAAFVSLFATGSRANLLMVIAVFAISALWILKIIGRRLGAGMALLIGLATCLLGSFVVLALPELMTNGSSNAFNRLLDTVSSGFGNDSSVLGRELSIDAGFEILAQNPFGISFSLFDIEQRTCLACGMEYPHSTILSYLLLWGPIPLVFTLGYLIFLLVQLLRQKSSSSIFVLFVLLTFVWYGAPLIYARSYFIYLILFTYVVRFCIGKGFTREQRKDHSLLPSSISCNP